MKNLLITGGAGFIGSNFVKFWAEKKPEGKTIVFDALTYAGNLSSIHSLVEAGDVDFMRGDICDFNLVKKILLSKNIDTIVHFAAESHVDRSIVDPSSFIKTNIEGTHNLLRAAQEVWGGQFQNKRFHHISTDEVYGDLGPDDPAFLETTPYAPRSPYAASKASSDLLVRAYYTTYGLPVTISNCSNNYGPFQFPEKLIPLMLIHSLLGKPLPIYGKGQNVRDWLFVDDHCRAIEAILLNGTVGETYNVGGENEIINFELVMQLCRMIDKKFATSKELQSRFPACPASRGEKCESLLTFVQDRLGHDRRYAINQTKIKNQLGFKPLVSFTEGLESTINWYLKNQYWWEQILNGEHQKWLTLQYGFNF